MGENKLSKWKLIVVISFIVLLGILVFNYKSFSGNSIVNPVISGKAILEASSVYKPDSNLEGDFKISLKQGELVPADSKVVVSLNDNNYEYNLEDLISNEKVKGDFYLENINVSGNGEGYGLPGSSSVNFVMKITRTSNEASNEENETTSETVSEANSEVNNSESTTTSEETSGITNESTSEASVEETTETTTNSEATTEETSEETAETTTSGEVTSEITSEEATTSETNSDETGGETTETSVDNSETAEVSESSGSLPITGNAVFKVFKFTGRAISDVDDEIKGSVSKDRPYVYELNDGETAEIVFSDQSVDLKISDKKARVTTDFGGEGFGKNYLGEESYGLVIDLSSLEIKAEEGDLKIYLTYNGQEITSVSNTLSVESSEQPTTSTDVSASNVTETIGTNISETNVSLTNQTLSNVTITNQTNATLTNQTVNATRVKANTGDYALSDEELSVLKSKTGSGTVSITKSEVANGRLIIRFQVGDYWLENSYDSSMSKEDLDYQINLDRVKWVKHLAQNLGQSESKSETAESYLGEYTL